MTTMTKAPAKKAAKTVTKRAAQKPDYPPLPSTAEVLKLAGRDYVVVPLDDYDAWLQDAMFAVILEERLKNGPGETISFDEFEKRLDAKKKRR